MGVLWGAYIVVFMQRLSVGPLAPFLKDDMGLTSAQVGSLISASSFGYMLSIIPAGWAVDRMGVRRLLAVGPVVGGIIMLGMFFVPSYHIALVVMAMSGFGCSCLMPSTTKGVTMWFSVRERATIMGLKQTGVNVGSIITAVILPAIALSLGWRYGFLLIGLLAIIIGIISFALYRDPPVSSDSQSREGSADTITVVPAKDSSLRRLLRSRDIWFTCIVGFAIMVVEFAVITHLVLYLTEDLLYPVVTAGVILAITQAGGVLGKPGSGLLSDRVFGGGRRSVFMLWIGVTCLVCLVVALWGRSLSWGIYPILFTFGVTAIGWGGVYLALVAELTDTRFVGTVTGITGVFALLGCMLGPVLFGYLVDVTGSYRMAWLSCAAFAAICVVFLLFVREEKRRV